MAFLSMTEDQLSCSICLEVYKDPVSTPCGHNFCMHCILEYWSSNEATCPLCKQVFARPPELRVNTFIYGIVEEFTRQKNQHDSVQVEGGQMETEVVPSEALVLQMIQARLQRVEEIKLCVERSRASLGKARAESERVLANLLTSFERCRVSVLKETEEKQRALDDQADTLIKELEQDALSGMITDSHNGLDYKTSRHLVFQLEDTFRRAMRDIMKKVDVTLDLDTANNFLSVSEDGKQVTVVCDWRNLPVNNKRFNTNLSVLGRSSFATSFYFQVQVSGKNNWGLGLARQIVNRKGKIIPSPVTGFWTLWLTNGTEYKAAEDFPVPIYLNEKPQKVGVFVDCEEGTVSFYDAGARSHIYSFTGCEFNGELFPFLGFPVNDGHENSTPLVILPVVS
ncbi:E3 ubiquitin-protein ligase TRIM21-like [Aplochiton taeniatus]